MAVHAVVRFDTQFSLPAGPRMCRTCQASSPGILALMTSRTHMLTSVVNTDRALPFALRGVVDFAHGVVGLVHAVRERQAHHAVVRLKLVQDGFGKRFGRDAGAIGNEENSAVGHGGCFQWGKSAWYPHPRPDVADNRLASTRRFP